MLQNSKKKTVVTLNLLNKQMPKDTNIEEAVLGALLLEKEAINEVIEILSVETFYEEKHQKIYEAILSLFSKSVPVDLATVSYELREMGVFEFIGNAYGLAVITQNVNSAANIVYHSRILQEMAMKRDLIRISGEIQRDAYEDTEDVFKLLDKSEQNIFDIAQKNIKKNYENISNIAIAAIRELEEKRKRTDGLTGIGTGFTALDRVTSGWQKSDLIIIAARPAMGKTAFVLSALRNAAVEFNKPVALFSLEMSAVQLMNRLLSAEAEIQSDKIRNGRLDDSEWDRLVKRTAKLSEAKFFIDDTPAISVLDLRSKCRRLKYKHDIQLIVVDYLQLMAGDSSKNNGNREQEIAYISRSLKQTAKELDVPIIALSQLSRAVEVRGGDKKPQLSDLRESGSIEQDADQVLFLYRPEYYGLTEDEEGNSTKGVGKIIIAKNRNGGVGEVALRFIGEFTKFTDLDANGGAGFEVESNQALNNFANQNLQNLDNADNQQNIQTFGSKLNNPDVPF